MSSRKSKRRAKSKHVGSSFSSLLAEQALDTTGEVEVSIRLDADVVECLNLLTVIKKCSVQDLVVKILEKHQLDSLRQLLAEKLTEKTPSQ